jgi:hypothetical protein
MDMHYPGADGIRSKKMSRYLQSGLPMGTMPANRRNAETSVVADF